MNDMSVSRSDQAHCQRHVNGEDALLEALRAIWTPHRQRDLEVRYELGVLLNQKLGSPAVRQSYGQGTIQRVSRELDLDKSDISRMRRFADQFKSFEAFRRSEPNATSWHKVRQLVTRDKTSKRAPDSRALWGVQRSVQASIKALSLDLPTSGRMADEVRSALRNLFRLAHERLGFEIADQTQRVDA